MKPIVVALAAVALLTAQGALAQTRPLQNDVAIDAAVARSQLEFFRGTWTIEGFTHAYSEVCDWLPGKGFLACHAEDRAASAPSYSMSVFGYSEADAQYTYSGFGGTGSQRSLQGSMLDGVWRFHGQTGRGPAWRRWQITIIPTDRGFRLREERSDRSEPWSETAVVEYVRVAR